MPNSIFQTDETDLPENPEQDIDVPAPVKPTFPDNTITYDEVDLGITIDDSLK